MDILAKVYSFADKNNRHMGKAIFLLALSAMLGVVPYYMVYLLIIDLTQGTLDASFCILTATIIFISLALKHTANEFGLKASHRLAYDTLAGMRKKAADKLLKMPMGNIQRRGSGELKKIFVENIESMELILAHGIPEGIGNVLAIVVTLTLNFIVDWRLALCVLAVLPIGMAIITVMGRNATQKLTHYYESSQQMNDEIVEYIRGMEVIKVFTQGDASFARYQHSVRAYKKFSLEWYHSCWKYMAAYGTILPATWLFTLPVGMLLYLDGSLAFTSLVLCLLLALAIGPMFMRLVTFIPVLPSLAEKYKRIEVLFDEPDLKPGSRNIQPKDHAIAFENVTFAYKEQDVIHDMSFLASQGDVTAIVGESGAGKSTVARLIARFWDVDEGRITLGGHDIRDYPFSELMNSISYVAQDSFLFDTTIMDNIRHGNPQASDDEVIEIARKARCHDFIMQLPEGYRTRVGEAGDRLSGGQRQRITIARAMLKGAPVVILDEATSSTDAENEDQIQEALHELLSGKTILVIAHRLSTITAADNIIVLDRGRIVDQGTHDQLLESSVAYRRMWERYQASVEWEYRTVRQGARSC